MKTDYSSYTYNDHFWLKRRLHRQRFGQALKRLNLKGKEKFLDYGTGDGYFLRLIAKYYPKADLSGFEPYSVKYQQLKKDFKDSPIKIYSAIKDMENRKFDRIACLDTAEHLSDEDLEKLLAITCNLLDDRGLIIFTVPIEIGLPALFKYAYRKARRPAYDNLNFTNYLKSIFGLRIERKVSRLEGNLDYIFSHVGFDHRHFEAVLKRFFLIKEKTGYPFPRLGAVLNNTLYYVCQKYPAEY